MNVFGVVKLPSIDSVILCYLALVTLLVIVFLASFIGFVVMWFTNTYNNVLFEVSRIGLYNLV